VLRFLMVEHLAGGAPVDSVGARDIDGLQDALDAMASAVGRGDEASSVARLDEAIRALVLVRELVMAR
jgi:hypothetical protein